jgi:hypothetical protein
MPFSPSDFEWWMWLLFAVGAAVVFLISFLITSACSNNNRGFLTFLFSLVTFAAGLSALGCILIAIIRFAKWAWAG